MKVETTVITTNNLRAFAAGLVPALGRVVAKTVADVEAGAKNRAPVDTGALVNSISGVMTGTLEGVVSAGMDYAAYVEEGTVRAEAQPFLRPAIDEQQPAFTAAVTEVLKRG